MRKIHLLLLLSLTFCLHVKAQIRLEEDFADWQTAPLKYADVSADAPGIDFLSLFTSSDSLHLYLKLVLDREINLQDNNRISVFLDTDNDASTGRPEQGIGADLIYTFGQREGTYVRSNGTNVPVRHAAIGLVSSPTVTSDTFEIAINRRISIAAEQVFRSDSIRIVFKNEEGAGDRMPEASGGLLYALENRAPADSSFILEKQDPDQLRILSYNVLRDGFWNGQQAPALERIINTLHPDIIGFQEIYDHTANETAARVNNILFSKYNQGWYQSKVNPDIICVSKYPILGSYEVSGNGAFLLDMGSYEMLFFVAHPPCCTNDFGRQDEIDAMMAFIRDAKAGIGPLRLAPNSPIVIAGDMNLVGLNAQRHTMLTGDISNNGAYGSDFAPDWNGASLIDANPFTTGLPMTFTWYREGSSFAPGRLDYLVYSGSNMKLENSFALFTPAMNPTELFLSGLEEDDAVVASDHLPLIGDFRYLPANPTGLRVDDPALQFRCFPNPAAQRTVLSYSVPASAPVSIRLIDKTGRTVFTAEKGIQEAGSHEFSLQLEGLQAGVYLIRLQVGKRISHVMLNAF
jgi:exonuclease III